MVQVHLGSQERFYMIVLFISVLGITIKCINAQWCEAVNPKVLTDLITIGGVEILFELGELIRIYGAKDRVRHNK